MLVPREEGNNAPRRSRNGLAPGKRGGGEERPFVGGFVMTCNGHFCFVASWPGGFTIERK